MTHLVVRARLVSSLSLVLALAGCHDDPRPSVADADGGVTADAPPVVIHLDDIRALDTHAGLAVDPRALDALEQPAEPVRVLFVEESDLELGRAWDPQSRTLGGICAHGEEVLTPVEALDAPPSWASNRPLLAADLGYAPIAIGPELAPPPQLGEVLDAMGLDRALTEDLRMTRRWGHASLAATQVECEGPVVSRVTLEQRSLTRLRLAFREQADREAFVARHGTRLLDIIVSEGAERDSIQSELAGRAVIEVWHLQIGGDRFAAEAVLRRNACSVTELAACAELMSELEELASIEPPAPAASAREGWIAMRGGAEVLD